MASEHTSTIFNKIIIPVITTVLGATAIYFLGFNQKSGTRTDMEKMLISKEATLKAWKSFVTTSNISNKNTKSIIEEYAQKISNVPGVKEDFEKSVPVLRDFQDELLRERKKAHKDIEDILKDEDIDRDFISMLSRSLDNAKEEDRKAVNFFDNIIAVAKSGISEEEKKQKLQNEYLEFDEMGKRMEERMTTEAEGIAKILAERYNQAFNLNDLDIYVEYKKEKENGKKKTGDNELAPADPDKGTGYTEKTREDNPPASGNYPANETMPTASQLTGQWLMAGGSLELSGNGDMYWAFEGKGYTSGDWKLVDGKLRMNATNPDTKKTSVLIGFLSNVSSNSFTMTFMSSPKEVYYFRRKN